MSLYQNDAELFALLKEKLCSAVIGDVLDQMGYHHQFLPQEIKPLVAEHKLAGRAMTVLEVDAIQFRGEPGSGEGPLSHKPYGLMLEALDSLKEDEIYLATGTSLRYALWGELMSLRAKKLKAAGAIVNGFLRDANKVRAKDFCVFSRGLFAQDQGPRGKVIDYRCPVKIDNVVINDGDLVFADVEGVIVIPRECEKAVVRKAIEKVSVEDKIGEAIENGLSATEAFSRYSS